MFFAVHDLELRKVRFDVTFKPGQIEILDRDFRQREPIHVEGTAELVGSVGEILVSGRLSGALDCECDRCLVPVTVPFGGDFSLEYWPSSLEPEAEEREIHGDDTNVGFYQGAGLELADVVREQVLLWMPMQRLCRPDCHGICAVCGQNRNVTECGCHIDPVDERWAALKNIRS